MLTNLERLQAVREAATVQRCHTARHYGSYDIAQHSFGVASIILCLHPNPSVELLKAGLWHDVHERWTGDIPQTVKEIEQTLTDSIEAMENSYSRYLISNVGKGLLELKNDDLFWLIGADMLDLWLWADEHSNDSAGVRYIREHVQRRIFNSTFIPDEISDALDIFVHGSMGTRLDLLAEKIKKGAQNERK